MRFVPHQQPTDMENAMSDATNDELIQALKIAFCYMPKAIEVNKYEYGDRYQTVLDHIQTVRETLLINEIDPEEVYGEINPDSTPNSSY
ncbi:penicillin-binding protein [Cellvibrio sp. KY-YJ-3]|uniref:penicillin-binding protein n=1 Tax=Cellvibrio sp. KY-YJ-3 TaxID=454662 RepID=UPI00351A1F70